MAVPSEPYHSIESTDPDVYHDYSDCPDGLQILPENVRWGTNNWPCCGSCERLDN
jgi:hypothetical protein